MNGTTGRRRRELDQISDALLHSCEEFIRGYEQHWPPEKMDQLADSVQQLFKQRRRDGDDKLPLPAADVVPTLQVHQYDDITTKQFLSWVAVLHKVLKDRTGSRYGR